MAEFARIGARLRTKSPLQYRVQTVTVALGETPVATVEAG